MNATLSTCHHIDAAAITTVHNASFTAVLLVSWTESGWPPGGWQSFLRQSHGVGQPSSVPHNWHIIGICSDAFSLEVGIRGISPATIRCGFNRPWPETVAFRDLHAIFAGHLPLDALWGSALHMLGCSEYLWMLKTSPGRQQLFPINMHKHQTEWLTTTTLNNH